MSAPDYMQLPVFSPAGDVHLVVETPKGARAKFKFEPRLCAFLYSRPLARGLCYPFDWGFVPSTCAPDGDPLDGMIVHDATSFSGAIIPCRALGILEVEQSEKGKKSRNDRLMFCPSAVRDVELSDTLKDELVQFFRAAVHGTGKTLHVLGWRDALAARTALEEAAETFRHRRREKSDS